MSIRPSGPNQGTIFCDTKTPFGMCKNEFESLEDEDYQTCLRRAIGSGWAVRGHTHLCLEHVWLLPAQ